MSAPTIADNPRFSNRRLILLMALGAVAGAALAGLMLWLAAALHINLKTLSNWDAIGGWVAVTLIGSGAFIGILSFNRLSLAKNTEGDDATLPATDDEVSSARLQSYVLLLAGGLLLVPILFSAMVNATPSLGPRIFLIVVLGFLVQSVLNLRLWLTGDEFIRTTTTQVCAMTFGICQALLFLWAVAERLHVVRAISTWDCTVVMMVIYMLCAWSFSLKQLR